jgi:2-amino-4-hydroxy-6-hydroxymethyldihydropteridine diphosphokinase
VTRVFLSLGSNLGDRLSYLRSAAAALDLGPNMRVDGTSRIYETAPVEVEEEQPEYLNCVVEVECDIPAIELMRYCQGVEADLGRERKGEKAPRTVDIDVLLFGEEVIKMQDLTVPHPGIMRAFNLKGIADIDPKVYIPGRGAAGDLLSAADLDGVREFGEGL